MWSKHKYSSHCHSSSDPTEDMNISSIDVQYSKAGILSTDVDVIPSLILNCSKNKNDQSDQTFNANFQNLTRFSETYQLEPKKYYGSKPLNQTIIKALFDCSCYNDDALYDLTEDMFRCI